jgi:hypothetical protein
MRYTITGLAIALFGLAVGFGAQIYQVLPEHPGRGHVTPVVHCPSEDSCTAVFTSSGWVVKENPA